MALGICEYIRDAYNVFDAIIAAQVLLKLVLNFPVAAARAPRDR